MFLKIVTLAEGVSAGLFLAVNGFILSKVIFTFFITKYNVLKVKK